MLSQVEMVIDEPGQELEYQHLVLDQIRDEAQAESEE